MNKDSFIPSRLSILHSLQCILFLTKHFPSVIWCSPWVPHFIEFSFQMCRLCHKLVRELDWSSSLSLSAEVFSIFTWSAASSHLSAAKMFSFSFSGATPALVFCQNIFPHVVNEGEALLTFWWEEYFSLLLQPLLLALSVFFPSFLVFMFFFSL